MPTIEVTISNPKGIHVRPASLFVKAVSMYDADVTVTNAEGLTISGSNTMELLLLGATVGTKLSLTATGPDEKEVLADLIQLVDDGFHDAYS